MSGSSHLPEVDVVLPDSPDDAGQLVGEGDGGLVVTAQALDLKGPGTQAIRVGPRRGPPENGAGAVSEEHAEIDVTALADGSEPADETTGVLARCQAEVAGEVTAGGEALDVADEGDQGGGGDEANAGDGAQPGDGGGLIGERFELVFNEPDAVLQLSDLGAGFGERRAQTIRKAGVGIGEQVPGPGENMMGTDGNDAAELAQQPPDRIQACGAGRQPGGAQAMQRGEGLLGTRLHGDGVDVLVAIG